MRGFALGADGPPACQAARCAAQHVFDELVHVSAQRGDAVLEIALAQRAPKLHAEQRAFETTLFAPVLGERWPPRRLAHARRGLDHHQSDDQALDLIEVGVRQCFHLPRQRRIGRCCIQKRREPCKPKQRPAVKPLQALIGDGGADETHGAQCRRVSTRSDSRAPIH